MFKRCTKCGQTNYHEVEYKRIPFTTFEFLNVKCPTCGYTEQVPTDDDKPISQDKSK